jgi:hypothetical protein
MRWCYFRFAVVLRLAVDLRAVDLRAVDLRAVDLRAVDLRAVDLRAVDLRAVDLLAVDFLAAGRRVVRLAVLFLAAVFLFAVVFLAAGRRVVRLAVLFLAAVFLLAVFLAGIWFTSFRRVSGRHALQASPLPFAHAAPHAVPLVAAQGVVEAFDPDGTIRADALRLAGGPALLGEEDLRVVFPTSRAFLPWNEVVHRPSPELHSCNSEGVAQRLASPRGLFFRRSQERRFACSHANRGVPKARAQGLSTENFAVKQPDEFRQED